MQITNFFENANVQTLYESGIFKVIQYKDDLSVASPGEAMIKYYMKQQNLNKRQGILTLNGNVGAVTEAGAMQMTVGSVKMDSGVKGVGDLFGKLLSGKVTGESAIKPHYTGSGVIFLEPTYRHLSIIDVGAIGDVVIEDGMFLAAEDTVQVKPVVANTISGALAGGEGLFNIGLFGKGACLLESRVPFTELICVQIGQGEELRIDGSYALMWDNELTMSVERSGRSLIGSAASGEGLVNVFRGSGRVWLEVTAAKPTSSRL